MKKRYVIMSLVAVLLLLLIVIPQNNLAHTEDEPFVTDMIACGKYDLGDIKVWNDDENLYVMFEPGDDWKVLKTFLSVELKLKDIPTWCGKYPRIYRFEFKDCHNPSVDSFTYEIPLKEGWDAGTELYLAAHALLVKKVQVYECNYCKNNDNDNDNDLDDNVDDDDNNDDNDDGPCNTRCHSKKDRNKDNKYKNRCTCRYRTYYRWIWGDGEKFNDRRCSYPMYFVYKIQDGDEPTNGKPLDIPEDPVQAYIGYLLSHGEPSYFDVELSGVPDGYDVSDGVWYDAWCADSRISVGGVNIWHTVTMYQSTDVDNLPAYATDDEQWDKINYILNQDYSSIGATWFEIQTSIYYLADENPLKEGWVWGQHDPDITAQIVEDANTNGGDFYPGTGQWMAIILDINDGVTQTNQLVIIVVDP